MTTLEQLVVESKCRKGPAIGTTKRGAFWLACESISLRRCGGDGIGNSGADVTFLLELRHYRDSAVRCMVKRRGWHQNHDVADVYQCLDSLAKCETVEQVICVLKGAKFADGYCSEYAEHVFSDYYADVVTAALTALGMPIAEPAPDES